MHKNQKGFGHIGAILIIVVIILIGLSGWFVWKSQGRSDKVATSAKDSDTKSQRAFESESKAGNERGTFNFVGGKVTFADDKVWKLATGGYWSNELQRCGRDTDRDSDCLDTQMLIPIEETFANPDQYQVNISVFSNKVTFEDLRPIDVGIERDATFSLPTFKAEKYHVDYTWAYPDPDETSKRVTYLLRTDQYTIRVYSTFFNGNNSSFKSDKNYYPYEAKVDELVKTLRAK